MLKPGGHLIAFGGTRTYHRMTCAIEDAGFEIRDCLAWLYGSGFPKSLDVSKAIDKAAGAEREKIVVPLAEIRNPKSINGGHDVDGGDRPWMREARERGFHEKDGETPATAAAQAWQGWGTALKPAHEPIVLARKPLRGTVAANVLAHGTGAINVEACRIGVDAGVEHELVERNALKPAHLLLLVLGLLARRSPELTSLLGVHHQRDVGLESLVLRILQRLLQRLDLEAGAQIGRAHV